jgi:hypothetical protein
MLSDGPQSNYAPSTVSKNWAFENYLAGGPGMQSEIELTQVDPRQSPRDSRASVMNQEGLASTQALLGPQRSYTPIPLHVSTDNLNESTGSRNSSPQHLRQMSGNMLAGQQMRPQSAGAYNAMMQYPPQQLHSRQSSGNTLGTPQLRSPSPGPYQAYSPQQSPQHVRQTSGNMLAQGGGPYPAYQDGRQSPGPYQSYSPHVSPQHARQMSGNMLSSTPPPGYAPTPPGLQQQQQQHHQHSMGNSGHGRGAYRGY